MLARLGNNHYLCTQNKELFHRKWHTLLLKSAQVPAVKPWGWKWPVLTIWHYTFIHIINICRCYKIIRVKLFFVPLFEIFDFDWII